MNEDTIYIGHRHQWGEKDPVPFGLQRIDRRHHVYVIGKTGSGKSTLLRNMLLQHVLAGDGVGLIDPHGDLAEELLTLIPPSRADDLVYFNPADINHPIGLNLLARVLPDERHLVVSGIVSAFKGIWRDSWGPRLEFILSNAVAALLECENVTLLGINRMLNDDAYRRRVVRQVKDPFIRSFWENEYDRYDERFRREAIAPIQNKVGQFFTSPAVRNVLGQVKNKVNLRFMMDTKRLFIANLSKGRLGEDKSNLLGSLLTAQFQLAAMSRSDQPEADRRDFYLFIDEFQNFGTDSFASILSEARKFRLCLTIGHQYITQLPQSLQDAVFGNVGTLISFRVGHQDAEPLSKEFALNYPMQSFVELDKYEILIRQLADGRFQDPFRAKTLPSIPCVKADRERLVARSREKYSQERAKVEDRIRRWMCG